MIIQVEHTSGGEPCNRCSTPQTRKSLNIKTQTHAQWRVDKSNCTRIRFCDACAVWLRDTLTQELPQTGDRE